jgi:acyl phosphate:glycerol-3-phosphate acyltransferase
MALFELTETTDLLWRLLLSYLLGAVPFGLVMCRLIKGVDLREVGSGNIGSTNAMRILGPPLGAVAFLLDFGKGFAPAAWIASDDPRSMVLCGAAAVIGHVWPVYLRFKGGKAVATGCGAIVAIDPLIFVGAGLAWLAILLLSGYVSLASIAMGLAFPALAFLRDQPTSVILGTGALTLLILIRHRSNIARLLAGEETRTRLWEKMHTKTSGGGGTNDEQ